MNQETASERWEKKTVSWSFKVSTESYPEEAKKLKALKLENGLVAEIFRNLLLNLTEEEIQSARNNIMVLPEN